MSGVYIKGVEMPTCCDYCYLAVKVGLHGTNKIVNFCRIAKRYDGYAPNIIPLHCPLIPVPDHGRLIDADKIGLTDFEIILCQSDENRYKSALQMLLEKIEKMPTIIPQTRRNIHETV